MTRKYLVYNVKSDSLDRNEIEKELVAELNESHIRSFKRRILRFYNSVDNKVLFIERLTEIFEFYNKPGSDRVVLFSQKEIDTVLEVLEDLRAPESKYSVRQIAMA